MNSHTQSMASHNSLVDFNAAAWHFQDPTRTRIICLMAHFKKVSVADLLQIIDDCPQQKLFRHLSYLRRDGMVTSFKHNQSVFYSFAHLSTAFSYMLTYANDLTEVQQDIKRYGSLLQAQVLIASEL